MLIEITEEQYSVLREIIGQCETKIVLEAAKKTRAKINHIESFKRGDYVKYNGGSDSKYLTKNSRYILTASPFRSGRLVPVINDKGRRVVCKTRWFDF